MKKGLIFVLGIMSFLGINTVSADTTTTLSNYYEYFEEYISDYNQYKENIDHLINYWEENYSSIYPYYMVIELLNGAYTDSAGPTFILSAGISNSLFYNNVSITYDRKVLLHYDSTRNEYNYNSTFTPDVRDTNLGSDFYKEKHLLISNGVVYNSDSKFLIPTYYSETSNTTISEIILKKGINYPTLISLNDGTYNYNIDELAPELELEDVLSNPLDTLKDVKDTIVNIFNTITEFISLLPDTMRTFLYLSFTVAIILGLLKIIL